MARENTFDKQKETQITHVTFDAYLLGYNDLAAVDSVIAVFIRDKTNYVKVLQAMKKNYRGKLKKVKKESLDKSSENLT